MLAAVSPSSTSAKMEQARKVLQTSFGHKEFRAGQEPAIKRLLEDGQSTCCIFPTGGGKSLMYQLPALCFSPTEDGLTLVVSPLIALMKDQVDAMTAKGIEGVAALDSSLTAEGSADIKDRLRAGKIRLLMCSPERFNNEGFVSMLLGLKVALFAVDEAHCISEWGQSFRPDYLKLPRFARGCKAARVLALTATATPKVAADICAAFDIDPDQGLFRTNSYRSNLDLRVSYHATDDLRKAHLISLFNAPNSLTKVGGATIVYVTLQKTAETVSTFLNSKGIKSEAYHAGMETPKRQQVQEWFMKTKNSVVVATIAFGMGIDHSHIRCVFHYNLPKSLESYSQEVGRAGRDGAPGHCEILLCPEDVGTLESFVYGDTPSLESVRLMLKLFYESAVEEKGGDAWMGFKKGEESVAEARLSMFSLGRETDIKDTVIKSMLAHLDLAHGLVTEITPMYGQYEISAKQPGWTLQNEKRGDPVFDALRRHTFMKAKWATVDVTAAAKANPNICDRLGFVRALQDLEGQGKVTIKATQVMNRFRLLKHAEDMDAIAPDLYKKGVAREDQEIGRLENVISWCTMDGCLAAKLAAHFGDKLQGDADKCGHCSTCKNGDKPIEAPDIGFDARLDKSATFDEKRWKAVLAVADLPKDDARLIARFALGYTSPRLTALKLTGKHAFFGSMEDHSFRRVLVEAEHEVAKNAGAKKRVADGAGAAGTKKQKY